MATTTNSRASEATRLHWRAQQQVATETRKSMRALWPLLLANLDAREGESWLDRAVVATLTGRLLSAQYGAKYFRTYGLLVTGRRIDFTAPSRALDVALRAASTGAPDLAALRELQRAAPDVADAIRESLRARGPVLRTAMRADGRAAAADLGALREVEHAAVRHALNGGREAVVDAVDRDPDTTGWRRVPNGDTCTWCLMLVDRGGVYRKSTVRFAAHDNCNCMCEPAWDPGRQVGVLQYVASDTPTDPDDRARAKAWIEAHREELEAYRTDGPPEQGRTPAEPGSTRRRPAASGGGFAAMPASQVRHLIGVTEALPDTVYKRDYLKRLRSRLAELGES